MVQYFLVCLSYILKPLIVLLEKVINCSPSSEEIQDLTPLGHCVIEGLVVSLTGGESGCLGVSWWGLHCTWLTWVWIRMIRDWWQIILITRRIVEHFLSQDVEMWNRRCINTLPIISRHGFTVLTYRWIHRTTIIGILTPRSYLDQKVSILQQQATPHYYRCSLVGSPENAPDLKTAKAQFGPLSVGNCKWSRIKIVVLSSANLMTFNSSLRKLRSCRFVAGDDTSTLDSSALSSVW